MNVELLSIFGAGLLTIVTPCVLPLIPIYLSLLATDASGKAAGKLSLLMSTAFFSLGLVSTFVALGLTATSLGRLLTEHRTQLTLLGGLLIFLFGLKFLGALQVSWLERERRLSDGKLRGRYRLLDALVMGLVFALGWTPCIGPILGSVLTYTASSTADPLFGALYLGTYGAGFVLPLMVFALFADGARQAVRRLSPWLPRVERVSGALMAGAGLYLMLSVAQTPEPTRTPSLGAAAAVKINPPLGSATSRPRMVQFTSPDCSVCRQMIPTVGVITRDCDGRQIDVVRVDVQHPDSRALAQRYRVRGVPTFVFLAPSGGEVARLVGYQTLAALRQALAALTGDQCKGIGLRGLFKDTPPTSSGCAASPNQPGGQCGSEIR